MTDFLTLLTAADDGPLAEPPYGRSRAARQAHAGVAILGLTVFTAIFVALVSWWAADLWGRPALDVVQLAVGIVRWVAAGCPV